MLPCPCLLRCAASLLRRCHVTSSESLADDGGGAGALTVAHQDLQDEYRRLMQQVRHTGERVRHSPAGYALQIITALGENKLVFILGGLIVYGIGNSIINYYSNMPLVKALANTDGGGAVKQGSGVAFVDGCLQSISTITWAESGMFQGLS
jgi:hypothetical protein